ncbi:arginase family protein [Achromobacter sp. NPDC058515]|uniref:arginase family protein n=1 Tax=Achromobacter sp. NPDC058515 TaxID=3346533 RepID=UPI00364C8B81
MLPTYDPKTLRLHFPQWQGGNNAPYHFGAQLLAWLAPAANGPVEDVQVTLPSDEPLPLENGIVGRTQLIEQQLSARELIDKHQPDRIVVLGGDCLVDLAPFAYLNERYTGDLAVLWIDSHPDLLTPAQFQHAHAMVLGNLLGNGDPDFIRAVTRPIKPENAMYAGLHSPSDWEASELNRLGLRNLGPAALAEQGSQPILDWFKATGAKHLAIHLDLDVLDPSQFRALLFANPDAPAGAFEGIAQGKLRIEQVLQVIADIANVGDVVGLGIAEHLPWDAIKLKEMLGSLPLLGRRDPRSLAPAPLQWWSMPPP